LALFEIEKYDCCNTPVAVPSQKRRYLDKEGKVVQEEVVKQTDELGFVLLMLRANDDGVENGYCKVPEPQEGDGKIDYRSGSKVTRLKEEGGRV
jgi:hypothetical protein